MPLPDNGSGFAVGAKLAAFALALACMAVFYDPGWAAPLSAVGYVSYLLQRKWRLLGAFAASQAALGALLCGIVNYGLRMPVFSEFAVLLFWNLYPVFVVAWDLVTTPPGELSAFLSRRGVPTFGILGVLVVFRFFPAATTELKSIGLSMRNRGLTRLGRVARHPLATGEYVLVPLLLRCLQIADQLTISATTRAAERPGLRSSYFDNRFSGMDAAWIAVWIACAPGLALKDVLA